MKILVDWLVKDLKKRHGCRRVSYNRKQKRAARKKSGLNNAMIATCTFDCLLVRRKDMEWTVYVTGVDLINGQYGQNFTNLIYRI